MKRRLPTVSMTAVGVLLVGAAAFLGLEFYRILSPNISDYLALEIGSKRIDSVLLLEHRMSSSGAFGSDSVSTYHFKFDRSDARQWLKIRPYNGVGEWQSGPISGSKVLICLKHLPSAIVESEAVIFSAFERGNQFKSIILDVENEEGWLQVGSI